MECRGNRCYNLKCGKFRIEPHFIEIKLMQDYTYGKMCEEDELETYDDLMKTLDENSKNGKDAFDYEDRVIVFMDILGFKEKVNSSVDDVKKRKTLFKVMEMIKEIEVDQFEEDGKFKDGPEKCIFSDSIVISYPGKTNRGYAYWILHEIMFIQIFLMSYGYISRGGVTFGKVFHKNNVIFGPAMVEAYELESEIAIFPRVIVSNEFLSFAKKNCSPQNSYKEEQRYIDSLLIQDIDQNYFVDYINVQREIEEDYREYIERMKECIITGLESSNLKICQKYNWLKYYYNSVVAEDYEIK